MGENLFRSVHCCKGNKKSILMYHLATFYKMFHDIIF